MGRPRKKAVAMEEKPDLQDFYAKRIDECQSVINHLSTCPAWKVIQKDLSDSKQIIDDNWQNLAEDDPKLKELRITKLAYMHLLQLTDKYALDLENAKKELDKIQNPKTKIMKDYDGN